MKLYKELGIYDCRCKPYLRGEVYCDKCIDALRKEINENGFSRIEQK